MPPTVGSIHADARVLLNNVGNDLFTDAVLLPFTKKAYQELQDELTLHGLQETKEEDATININAGVTAIIEGGAAGQYPLDLIAPITLWEKPQGAADSEYVEMEEGVWAIDEVQLETLRYWKWQENQIKLVGATTARTVKVKYYKVLTALVDANSNIPIINCQVYLAARVAAIAALVIGGNVDRAGMYQVDAERALTRLTGTAVKRAQNQPTRRKPARNFV